MSQQAKKNPPKKVTGSRVAPASVASSKQRQRQKPTTAPSLPRAAVKFPNPKARFAPPGAPRASVLRKDPPLGDRMGRDRSAVVSVQPEPEGPPGTGLSACASYYAKALCNPFGQFAELPCIPDYPPMPTQRERILTRGSFVTGTNGVGFVSVRPFWWSSSANGSTYGVNYSGSAFAGTSFAIPPTAGVSATNRASPFTYLAADGVQGRLVGLGLRIRNISKALSVGGLVYGTTGSTARNLEGLTQAQVAQDVGTQIVPQSLQPDNEWSVLVFRPMTEADIDFIPNIDGGETLSGAAFNCMGFLAIAPSTAAADAQTFEWEICEFWEFVGQSATTGQRVSAVINSDADPVGLARCLEGAQSSPLDLRAESWQRETGTAIINAIAHSDSVAKTVKDLMGTVGRAIPMVSSLLPSLLGFLSL